MKKTFQCNLFIGFLGVFGLTGQAWAGTSYTTKAATDITATSATLNGNAQSTIGLSGEVFNYGPTTAYGTNMAATPQGVAGPVSASISGLSCNTTYHFRFVGDPKPPRTTVQGSDMSFTTLACSPSTSGFSGAFAPSNWISGSNAPINLVNTSAAPVSVTLSSFPEWLISASSFAYKATSKGSVSFSYNYTYSTQTQSSPAACPASYWINGHQFVYTNSTPNNQTGSLSFDVNKGDTFSFALNGNGSNAGCPANNKNNVGLTPTSVVISNFAFTQK